MFFKNESYFKRKLIIFVLIIFAVQNRYLPLMPNNQKWVIGTNKQWGFFAAFFCTLSHIIWCKKNNKMPVVYWSNDSAYYMPYSKNVWEQYFFPVSNLKYQKGDIVHRNYIFPHPTNTIPNLFKKGNKISGKMAERYVIKSLIDQYIRIKPHINRKINIFFKKNMAGKKTIGIHLRGTDKPSEQPYSAAHILLAEANKYKGYQYFIATDEEKLLNLAKKTLRGKVIYCDSFRSKNKIPVHYSNANKTKIGEDILIEAQILSKCDKFIHVSSNVSMAVLCFNPNLHNIPK